MHVHAHLDVDLVAVEQTDQITLMLELVAPAAPGAAAQRPPATVQVVLDRSGSMGGERLDAARDALVALVDRLDPRDSFGLVTFDDAVDVVVPAGPVLDKPALRAAVRSVHTGGMTNLSAGLLRGVQEARRAAGDAGATVVLLSDGHANDGVTDPGTLEQVAASTGVSISTIGIGLDYDERLLSAIARGGRGDHAFAEQADAAGAAVAAQVDGLLSRTVQAASLLVRPTGDVAGVTVFNDLPAVAVGGGVMVELGDLWAGERRRVLLTLDVPALPGLGLAQVASVEVRYVALPALVEEAVTLPISVNVVPGDQAAGRIPDVEVHRERLFQAAQAAKRRATDALARGDDAGAASMLRAAAAPLASFDAGERDALMSFADQIDLGQAARSVKSLHADQARKSRKRGR